MVKTGRIRCHKLESIELMLYVYVTTCDGCGCCDCMVFCDVCFCTTLMTCDHVTRCHRVVNY